MSRHFKLTAESIERCILHSISPASKLYNFTSINLANDTLTSSPFGLHVRCFNVRYHYYMKRHREWWNESSLKQKRTAMLEQKVTVVEVEALFDRVVCECWGEETGGQYGKWMVEPTPTPIQSMNRKYIAKQVFNCVITALMLLFNV